MERMERVRSGGRRSRLLHGRYRTVTDKKSKTPNAKIVNDIGITHTEGLLENAKHTATYPFLTPLITDEQLIRGLQIYEEAIKACM